MWKWEEKAVGWFVRSIYICVCHSTTALLKIRRRNGGCAQKSASVRNVCLPPRHTQLPAGSQCTVAGYGNERHRMYHSVIDQLHHQAPECLNHGWHWLCSVGRRSQYLKKTEVNLISHDLCRSHSYYGKHITDNMLCAGSPDWTTDSCEVRFEQIIGTIMLPLKGYFCHVVISDQLMCLHRVTPAVRWCVKPQAGCFCLGLWVGVKSVPRKTNQGFTHKSPITTSGLP